MSSITPISNLINNVTTTFVNKEASLFWHYAANNYFKYEFNNQAVITARVQTIIKKIGTNSFEAQKDFQMTPLHVAAIRGNRAGIRFFLQSKVNTDVKDQYGNVAEDYAWDYHPHLIDLFPNSTAYKLTKITQKFFASSQWFVKLPAMKFPYRRHTQDFGREIKSLLIGWVANSKLKQKFNGKILSDLKVVCAELGIRTLDAKTQMFYYPRDAYVRAATAEGDFVSPLYLIKIPEIIPNLELPDLIELLYKDHREALEACQSHTHYFKMNAPSRTEIKCFRGYSGFNNVHQHALTLATNLFETTDLAQTEFETTNPSKKGMFHFDGGNVFILTNRQGKTKALVGRDHLLTNYMIYRKEPQFLQDIINRLAEERNLTPDAWELEVKDAIRKSITVGQIKAHAEDLYALGLIQQVSDDPQIEMIRKIAEESHIKIPFIWDDQTSEKLYREMAIDYEFEKTLTHYSSAETLALPLTDLHHISQAGYHLDTFMTPGPNHSVFVQDYQLCTEMLQEIKQQAKPLGLNSSDINHLDVYIKTAKRLQKELGPLIKRVQAEIAQADFHLISIPGCFYYESDNRSAPTHHINFMNALSGWSSKANSYYFITTGCHVGDQLGKIFMDSLTLFLRQYVPEIKTYFVGKDTNNNLRFSQAMDWWNQEEAQSGIHCFTLENETEDHQEIKAGASSSEEEEKKTPSSSKN